jgi:crossover junction endodeoxyribonuclease RuvC
MATRTLTQRETNASIAAAVPIEALAAGTPNTATILALDLGHRLGWALRSAEGGIISGVAEFRQDRWQGGGMKFLHFRRWLTELKADAGGLDAVLYEQVRSHAGVDASHAYGGWLAILTAWCEHHGIPYEGVPVGTIKRHIAGKGNADKAAVISAVRKLGFNPVDDNEADALALLNWAIAQGLGGDR